MKKLILLSLLFCGCSTNAWYQSGKSLDDSIKDCEECRYDVMKHNNPYSTPQTQMGYFVGNDTELLMQCMKLKGYTWTNVTDAVKNNQLQVRQDGFNPWYNVAGTNQTYLEPTEESYTQVDSNRKLKGYIGATDPKTGKPITVPVYEE